MRALARTRLDPAKLEATLLALEAGGDEARATHETYLAGIRGLFGSDKLADEAELILAALAAAEVAHDETAAAEAPTRIEPAGRDPESGEMLFKPAAMAPIGGLEETWQGAPLIALASVLDRGHVPQGPEDEVYSASFVYVLFRLKAVLGVWKGENSPDARYRLWLKGLAGSIADHPTLGLKVNQCRRRIAAAVFASAREYGEALQGAAPPDQPPPVFTAFAPIAAAHARASGLQAEDELEALTAVLRTAGNRASDKGRSGWQLRWASAEIGVYAGAAWPAGRTRVNDLAGAYMNRGNARQSAEGHGPVAAIADYDLAIEIREALRAALEPDARWDPPLRNNLAAAYMNRGNAKRSAEGHGPVAAIADYDLVIEIMGALRATLEPDGRWDPPLRNHLATALFNRALAKSRVGQGVAAMSDASEARRISGELVRAYGARGDPIWERVREAADGLLSALRVG
jgi:hypothetical protein